MNCTLRPLRADELGYAIDLAAAEGWNPGRQDAQTFVAADPGGFLVAEVAGERVGCIAAVSYGGTFGFIGLYIVEPAWRGQGLGLTLWQAGMARLAGMTVGLDGVPAQQANYRRSGFALAWQNARYAGTAGAVADAAQGAAEAAPSGRAVDLRTVDFAALCADDRRVFPAERTAFLRAWIDQPGATALGWRDAGGALIAWGVRRPCREGHKVGPLVADRPAVARALMAALCAGLPAGDAVCLDVPLPHADAVALAEGLGMQVVFETARMYAGPAPQIDLARVYGITTFELG